MAKKKKTCPECGGVARGRGYAHKAGCPKATQRTQVSSGASKAIDGRSLRRMSIEELLDLREVVDKAIKGKAPELKERIAGLQKTLKAIQGK